MSLWDGLPASPLEKDIRGLDIMRLVLVGWFADTSTRHTARQLMAYQSGETVSKKQVPSRLLAMNWWIADVNCRIGAGAFYQSRAVSRSRHAVLALSNGGCPSAVFKDNRGRFEEFVYETDTDGPITSRLSLTSKLCARSVAVRCRAYHSAPWGNCWLDCDARARATGMSARHDTDASRR